MKLVLSGGHVVDPSQNIDRIAAVMIEDGRIAGISDGPLPQAFADAETPYTRTPIALAGDAAAETASLLAARGADVLLTNAKAIDPAWIARAAQEQLTAGIPPHPAQPAYIDPPEAKLPAGGLRPAPL